MKHIFKLLIIILIIIGSLLAFVTSLIIYFYIRPNMAYIHPDLKFESWDVETDYSHNAFTDMVYWKDNFYLAFRAASVHAPVEDARIIVMKSEDAKDWKIVEEFSVKGKDIRDPKFGIIGDKLFIYNIVREINSEFDGEVTKTKYSFTKNGDDWEDLEDIEPENHRFWRTKTYNNRSWQCIIFEQGNVKLYNTTDGINWDKISTIYDEPEADETDFAFLPNRKIVVITRLQTSQITGDKASRTLISTASAPYTKWDQEVAEIARLDGPCLFNISDKLFAVARYQPEIDGLFQQSGSVFAKKRTGLYYVEKDKILYLSDLPSDGDTSYPAAVVKGKYLYVSYYTTDTTRDYPWFLGQISPAKVRIAKIEISSLEKIKDDQLEKLEDNTHLQASFPFFDYLYFFISLSAIGLFFVIIFKKIRSWKL
ncbi:MAG: hypothetical protein ACTSR8_07050 [Promethearchaeota archaeon]